MVRRRDDVAWADPSLLILGSLAEGPRHGYAIVADVREQTGVELGAGTVYTALARLLERRLIIARPDTRRVPHTPRRRPFEITEDGVRLLRTRLAAMSGFTTTCRARLAGRSAP